MILERLAHTFGGIAALARLSGISGRVLYLSKRRGMTYEVAFRLRAFILAEIETLQSIDAELDAAIISAQRQYLRRVDGPN